MSETLLPRPVTPSVPEVSYCEPRRLELDGRVPQLLDHHGHVLQVVAGHIDIFATTTIQGRVEGPRQHLFRVGIGAIVPDMPADSHRGGPRVQVLAVAGLGTEALVLPRANCESDLLNRWIEQLAKVIAGHNPSWEIREAEKDIRDELSPEERRRGPARNIAWISVGNGRVRLMEQDPAYDPSSPPLPLVSGMWIRAGADGATITSGRVPSDGELWEALDHFHLCAIDCLRGFLADSAAREVQRLVRRTALDTTQQSELFARLSSIVVPVRDRVESVSDAADPLLIACQLVGLAIHSPILRPPGRTPAKQGYAEVVEIARASRLRTRQTLLRGDWWMEDAGALLAWRGEARRPVALVRSRNRYVMTEPETGTRQFIDQALALELAPEAVTFYPTLPGRQLTLWDLLNFSIRHSRGNIARIVLSVFVMGLLTLVPPLITQVLVDSVIPRSELHQLTFCAIALGVTAIGMAGVQMMEGLAMLRLEGIIDWKLQAAVIDRVLRLPASLFREYTVGDFVDRSMGIDSVRRIFTGRVLRSLMTGSFCWVSILLMLIYDPKLALIAIALAVFRSFLIIGTSLVRLYHESRHFNLQGKVEGLVLQLLAGIGKLRVADATVRALAVWSKQFAAQKQHFIASQRAANMLSVFETAFPTLATLIIFASAVSLGSSLTLNLGAFLAFFAAFGQTMGALGAWASGVSEALVAIPHITRMRPLITSATEISDDRKHPGELLGGVELSRVTFRYVPAGPPVLEHVSLRINPGEYVAIIGPSGSGKSSLFRLLLGFEKPETGAVFYDGKALETLDTSAVRRQLGVVLQNGKLATGSLYDNICGGVQLPLEQAWEAARLAGLDRDIKAMPMGMHTAIAEGVSTLSGGQRQRVMIARAIARRPRILLFDEATSSLDNQSQAIVTASLGALNVTRIVIAHRLSTVREADRIIVLSEGKVVQSGTYDELSKAAGMFADFTSRQLL